MSTIALGAAQLDRWYQPLLTGKPEVASSIGISSTRPGHKLSDGCKHLCLRQEWHGLNAC